MVSKRLDSTGVVHLRKFLLQEMFGGPSSLQGGTVVSQPFSYHGPLKNFVKLMTDDASVRRDSLRQDSLRQDSLKHRL